MPATAPAAPPGVSPGSRDEQLAYAARAQAAGVQIIWNMSDPAFRDGTDLSHHFSRFAESCGARTNDEVPRCYVELVRDLPATWGYNVGDEVPPSEAAAVRAFSASVAALDARHPRLYVAQGRLAFRDQRELLWPFLSAAEVGGADYYPVSTSEPLGTIRRVAANVQALDHRARRADAFVLQAFSWGQYPDQGWVCSPFPQCATFPTREQMRRMRDGRARRLQADDAVVVQLLQHRELR